MSLAMFMAMATASAALMAVAVLVAVAVATAAARGALGLRDLARKEGVHDVVAVARRTGIDIDAGLSEGVNSPTADATADKHVDAACCKHAGKSAMTSTIRAYYLRGYNLTTLNVVDLEYCSPSCATRRLRQVAERGRTQRFHP